MTDEMYWISTAKTVHMLWTKDLQNPLWREYYGFANFNGAKFIYGIGLALFGHTDVTEIGVAPETYYRWIAYDGSPFPKTNKTYLLVRDARIISAFSMAAAGALLFILARILYLPRLAAIAASVILVLHPISYIVATHAFADSMFVFFEVLLLLLIFQNIGLRSRRLYQDILIGITLALVVSVKLNGLMFISIIASKYAFLWMGIGVRNHVMTSVLCRSVFAMTLSFTGMMIIMHPNFIFYPQYSPLQLFRDRVHITQDHILYFSAINPSHVTLSLPSRIASLYTHAYPIWLVLLSAMGMYVSRIHNHAAHLTKNLIYVCVADIIITCFVLSYTVFDEPRYYLPIIPFIALIAAHSFRIEVQRILFRRPIL